MHSSRDEQAPTGRLTSFERLLRLVTEVRPGEGTTGILLVFNIFLILAAYYFIKPVREGWLAGTVIGSLSKMEIKAISVFGQSLLLFALVPLYASLYRRLAPRALILGVNLFLTTNLFVFWVLRPGFLLARGEAVAVGFYLWVGMFSVLIVAQFWAFAADLYSHEEGKRLLPLVAVGASAGAVSGSWLGSSLLRLGLDSSELLPAAAVPLLAATLLTLVAERRGPRGEGRPEKGESSPATESAPEAPKGSGPSKGDGGGPYRLIFRHRYLTAAALLVLVFNWVVTNGENVLFGAVQEGVTLEAAEQGLEDPAALARFTRNATSAFYGDLYFWINLLGLALQAFAASRILRYGGFGAILLLPPLISMLAYGAMAALPVLAVIKWMKIAENSTNYSLNNTARHVLWLPTSQRMKYEAKPAVDTLFVRIGDGLAAATILVGVRAFDLQVRELFLLNLVLAAAWMVVGVVLVRDHRRLVLSGADATLRKGP